MTENILTENIYANTFLILLMFLTKVLYSIHTLNPIINQEIITTLAKRFVLFSEYRMGFN